MHLDYPKGRWITNINHILYLIGLLIYGVFAFVQFLTQGGFFGLLIFGWIISIIYHFLFSFLPFLFNVVA